ncbi:MAG: transposase [Bryobacteraceae bacterium]|nr:transposase [Bryobacteraceae bacterium]
MDRETRKAGLSAAERMALRKEHVTPWVREIRKACQYLVRLSLPQSALGKACRYTLNQWEKLNRFSNTMRLSCRTTWPRTRCVRPVAIGRKNWLHVGSQKAGPKVAAIPSPVESCRRLGVPVREYLAAVLPGLQHKTTLQASRLTPARWAASLR